jgi:hypothetical protein
VRFAVFDLNPILVNIHNKKFMRIVIRILLLMIIYSFNSCSNYCNCTKDLVCKILTVKKLRGINQGSIVRIQTYCSQIDYLIDRPFIDSVNSFANRYTSDSTTVETKDSVYKKYPEIKAHRNIDSYRDSGYFCNCAR